MIRRSRTAAANTSNTSSSVRQPKSVAKFTCSSQESNGRVRLMIWKKVTTVTNMPTVVAAWCHHSNDTSLSFNSYYTLTTPVIPQALRPCLDLKWGMRYCLDLVLPLYTCRPIWNTTLTATMTENLYTVREPYPCLHSTLRAGHTNYSTHKGQNTWEGRTVQTWCVA